MRKIKQIEISFYRDCFQAVPITEISLYDWLLSKSVLRRMVDEVRKESDVKKRSELKFKLPVATIGGVFSGRTLDTLVKDSRLICLDIDGKDNPTIDNMEDLKKEIATLPYVLYCGLSVGGQGLMCIIELRYPDRFLSQFLALEEEFRTMGITIDKNCKDKNRLRFYSYDPNYYLNKSAEVFEGCLEHSLQKIPFASKAPIKSDKKRRFIEPIANGDIDDIYETYLKPMDMRQKTMVVFKNSVQFQIYDLIKKAIAEKVDITAIYADWIAICFVIKRYFDEEDGLQLFLEVSQFFHKFTEEECIETYQKCDLQRYQYSVDRLFEICHQYGLLC